MAEKSAAPFILTIRIGTGDKLKFLLKVLPKIVKASTAMGLLNTAGYIPPIGAHIDNFKRSLLEKKIDINQEDKIVMNFSSKPLEILWDDLILEKESERCFKFNIKVRNFDLDLLLDEMLIKRQRGSVKSILETINTHSEGKIKYELLSLCLDWINRYPESVNPVSHSQSQNQYLYCFV